MLNKMHLTKGGVAKLAYLTLKYCHKMLLLNFYGMTVKPF